MRVTRLLALALAGLAPGTALASGSEDEVMVVAGNRVTTTRGAFVAKEGGEEPDVVVLRGAEVGGAIPDPTRVERERRPFPPPVRSESQAREPSVRVQIVIPTVRSYGVWLPYKRGRHHRIKLHHGYPKHYEQPKKHAHRGKRVGVARAPSFRRSSILGAPHSRRPLAARRGGKGAWRGSGHGAGRGH